MRDTHADLTAMSMTELAKRIHSLFFITVANLDEQYNLSLAGRVWFERFGEWPVIGTICYLVENSNGN
jgi:hypothetical protein